MQDLVSPIRGRQASISVCTLPRVGVFLRGGVRLTQTLDRIKQAFHIDHAMHEVVSPVSAGMYCAIETSRCSVSK